MNPSETSKSHQRLLMILCLIVITLLPYLQIGGHDFVLYDDPKYVTGNIHILQGMTGETIRWALTATDEGFWHPLTWLSLLLDRDLYGLNPGGYHWTSALLHLMNTLLLFIILDRMTGAIWKSALVAVLFAVHPLHVESVAWIAERKDVLSSLFWMLTMGAYVLYVERPTLQRYLFILAMFVLGLMAKPMLVTLPFVLLLLDYWPLERAPGRSGLWRLVREKIPLIVVSFLAGMVTIYTEGKIGALPSTEIYPLGVRLANAIVSYGEYLVKTLWPMNLAFFYPYAIPIAFPKIVLAASFLLVVSIIALRICKVFPYVSVGWAWYMVTLLPVIGLIQVGNHAMADRYSYIPLIGIFVAAVWGTTKLLEKWHLARLTTPLATGFIMILSLLSWFQVGVWKNNEMLFYHALAVTSDNYVAHNNLGNHFMKVGRAGEAAHHYAEAVRIRPAEVKFLLNLGSALSAEKKYSEAVPRFLQAIRMKPDFADSYEKLADAYFFLGNDRDADGNYRKSLQLNPHNAIAENNLAMIMIRSGRPEEAIALLQDAIRHKPDFPTSYNNLGVAYAQSGRTDMAISQFQQALALDTHFEDARRNLSSMSQRHAEKPLPKK